MIVAVLVSARSWRSADKAQAKAWDAAMQMALDYGLELDLEGSEETSYRRWFGRYEHVIAASVALEQDEV
ncbi:hypothetical protein [Puerhibacterium puerhi]|uniref:hypothetical protein n=1 Tax=Puerhibacterium puerhi TaxID=2692623 RepID=UPI001359CBA8|nr:hypothetical protein [Puerhibacterium puerhi]